MTSVAKIYGQDLGVLRERDALEVLHDQITTNSAGPPEDGAVPQDDLAGSFVWSATKGTFLVDEDGNQLLDEDGNYLYG